MSKEKNLAKGKVKEKIVKENKEMEKELFGTPIINQDAKPEENQEQAPPMEMELEMDGADITSQMEEIVAEKVKQEEIKNKEQKHKPGPKPQTEEEKTAKKEAKAEESGKKEAVLNLKDPNTVQREIKKGRLSAPCFRIEKVDADNTYDLKMSPGVIFSKDAKYEKYDNVKKMVDGKTMVTLKAVEVLGHEKFKAKHENGEEIEHDWVRVELHKPGRDKDVVELYSVRSEKEKARKLEAEIKKKAEEAKKKAEKEAAKKAEEVKVEETKEELKQEENKQEAIS